MTAALGLVVLCSFAGARAQSLRDPMRPPSVTAAEGGQAQDSPSSGLQIVRSSGTGRTAVIDGAEVRVGGKVAGSTLIALTDNSAVLRNAEGQVTTLKMFPASEKILPPPAREQKARTERK